MSIENLSAALKMNEALAPGEALRSADGNYVLHFQRDGDLVLSRQDDSVVWTSGTQGRTPATLRLQEDGDLVIHGANGEVLWAASEHGGERGPQHRGSTLVVQDDGTLVIRDSHGAPTWTSPTGPAPDESSADDDMPQAFTGFALLLNTK